MESRSRSFLNNAANKLKKANEELFRPEDDVVSFSVCKNSQYAIESYLKGYLLKNKVDPGGFLTIDQLYKQCALLNKDFEKIDLTDLACKSNALDSRYCNNITKVKKCFDVADSLDTFLRQEKII